MISNKAISNKGDPASDLQVALFVTCLADIFRPSVASACVQLIRDCGAKIIVPVQSCCGQPAYNSGYEDKAKVLAKQFVEQFDFFDYVVAPSGSCVAMVRIHYPELFKNDTEWHQRSLGLANKTFELSEFLVDVMKVDVQMDANSNTSEKKFSYHDSCSGLRELGIRRQPRKLLNRKCGITINEMDNSEICCGFGGTFCIKYPEISTTMVDNKIAGFEHLDADILLGGDLGCLMNIAGRLKRKGKSARVYHYAEILAAGFDDHGLCDDGISSSR